jgi:hypothetical protein
MNRLSLLALVVVHALALAACREPPPENTSGCDGEWYEEQLPPSIGAPVGDVSCYTHGEWDDTAGDASCQGDETVSLEVFDYQDQEPVSGSVSILDGDSASASEAIAASPTDTAPADTVMAVCTPYAYRTTRDGAVETVGMHAMATRDEDPIAHVVQSVSDGSKSLLELTFQVTIDDANGSVVGIARGCDDEPLGGVQVVIRDADCKTPDSAVAGYFSNQIPDAFRAETSDDGVYAVFDVPPGNYVVDMYIARDQEAGELHELAGESPVEIVAGAVTVADIRIGRQDGVYYPPSCFGCQ